MKLDKKWKKIIYRIGLVFTGLSFPLGTIVVGLNIFVINQGKEIWKTTDTELHGIVEKILYIFGWLMIFGLIFGLLSLALLS